MIRDDEERSEDEEGPKANGDDAAGLGVQEKKKTKRKVTVFRFKPDMLTNQDRGIKCLYENSSKAKLFDTSEKGPLDEVTSCILRTHALSFYLISFSLDTD